MERKTGILTEVDCYGWSHFPVMAEVPAPMFNASKMEIRGMMARKGDTPEYVNKIQQEVFEVLAEARCLEELQRIEPKARDVYKRYLEELNCATAGELAIAAGLAG